MMRKLTDRLKSRKEQGSVLVITVLLLPLMLVLTGLAVDGGLMYLQYQRVTRTANLGAQAASHAIDEQYFARTNRIRLDYPRAMAFAQQYANENSTYNIHVTNVTVRARQVEVTAMTTYKTLFMQIGGTHEITLHVKGKAYPAYGIDREWQ